MTTFSINLSDLKEKIKRMAPSETKYYLVLLLHALTKVQDSKLPEILAELDVFIDVMEQVTAQSAPPAYQITQLAEQYQRLANIINAHRVSDYIWQSGLYLVGFAISGILSVVMGVLGAVKGLALRSSILAGAHEGFVIGFSLGLVIGYRIPHGYLKDQNRRQLRFSLNGINHALTTQQSAESFGTLYHQVYNDVKERFDKANSEMTAAERAEKFNEFLTQASTPISIIGVHNKRYSHESKGYEGHHGFIRFELFGGQYIMEQSTQPSRFDKTAVQMEQRQLTGEQVIDLIAFYQQIKPLHDMNKLYYMLTEYKGGENDCFTFLDKLFIAINEQPTSVDRDDNRDKAPALNLRRYYNSLSAFPRTEVKQAFTSENEGTNTIYSKTW